MRVIAILKDNSTGRVVIRISETVLANTTKVGNYIFPIFPKEMRMRMRMFNEVGVRVGSLVATVKKSVIVQTALQILYSVIIYYQV